MGLWILRSGKVFVAKPVYPPYIGTVVIETNSLWFILPGSALQLGMKEGSEPAGIIFTAVCLLLAHLVCKSQTQTDPAFHSFVIHVEMLNYSTEHAKKINKKPTGLHLHFTEETKVEFYLHSKAYTRQNQG